MNGAPCANGSTRRSASRFRPSLGTPQTNPCSIGSVRRVCARGSPRVPIAIVMEDAVNWCGEYWERSLHPSEARYKKALGGWVPEGYETDLEELHRTVASNALRRLATTLTLGGIIDA